MSQTIADYRTKCFREKNKVCEVCERDSEEVEIAVHHKDGDRHNNSITNLVPLCMLCHKKVHTPSYETENEQIQDLREELGLERNTKSVESTRKGQVTLSLPSEIATELRKEDNMSSVVASLLREHYSGELGKAELFSYQRVNFSLPPDVVETIDDIPQGERSEYVAEAIRDYEGDE